MRGTKAETMWNSRKRKPCGQWNTRIRKQVLIFVPTVIFDIGEKVSSGSNKGQVLLLSCLTFGLITVRESIYKHMDGQITVDLLVGVLQGKVKVPQTTSI